MRILIIGGSGNISTAITRQLTAAGEDVTLFKRSTSLPEGCQGIKVIPGDRTNAAEFREKLSSAGPFDSVVDMVCYEPDDAETAIEVFRGRTRQFLFCSTVDVYTKSPPGYPVTEENGVVDALESFPYAWKKVACERAFGEAQRRGDFALTILRPAATYNDTWSPGVHSFGGQTYHLDRIRKGKPILLHGDGTSIWVAAHRDDVAPAFVAAIGDERTFGQDYNVIGDEWMTQNHIWRTIASVMRAPEPEFVYIPTDLLARLAPKEAEWCRENFRYNNIFDNSKAKRDLGFRYTIPFAVGARRCIEYLTRTGAIEDCSRYPFYDRIVDRWRNHTDAMVEEFRSGSA